MDNILIVFSGKAQSGKSTSATLLREAYESKITFKIWSFASELKRIAYDIFNWDGDKGLYYNHGPDGIKPRGFEEPLEIVLDKGRQLLIEIGGAFRRIRQSVWADLIMKKINEFDKDHPDFRIVHCIDDLRFKNELKIVKTYTNCITIRLTRQSSLKIDDQSENDLDDTQFDYYIENNGTKEELQGKLKEIVEKHMKIL